MRRGTRPREIIGRNRTAFDTPRCFTIPDTTNNESRRMATFMYRQGLRVEVANHLFLAEAAGLPAAIVFETVSLTMLPRMYSPVVFTQFASISMRAIIISTVS